MNTFFANKKLKLGIAASLVAGMAMLGQSSASADTFDSYGPRYLGEHPAPIYQSFGVADSSSAVISETVSTASTTYSSAVTTNYTANTYPVGQCTWGVKELAPWVGNYWGNGGDWAASAAAQGYTVGTTPQVGAFIVWTDGSYGHVAYVTDVAADGTIQVMESNFNGNMSIGNYRGWFNPTTTGAGTVSYIYPPADA